MTSRVVDALVVGAGFGGLGAALSLAERGASVVVCEALKYPGGCASTFDKGGHRFEAGATLFSGLGEEQLFGRWIRQHQLDVDVQLLDPAITFRSPGLELPVASQRAAHLEALLCLPGAPKAELTAFFRTQARVADALWPVFDDAGRLPPFTAAGVGFHLSRAPRYLPVLRWVGRPLLAVLEAHGLAGFAPLRTYLDAVCQITVQAPAAEAEAPFALAAMDYCFRGTGHVRGGIGELAWSLLRAAESLGAEVRLPARVRGLRRRDGLWEAEVRGERIRARQVVANVLPQALPALLGERVPEVEGLGERVKAGWGAVMRYFTIQDHDGLPAMPTHLQLVGDPASPFVEGNHVFVSVGPRAVERTVTMSTHLALDRLRGLGQSEQAAVVGEVQARMGRTLAGLAPELDGAVSASFPASPRTFARFTLRPEGAVGGIPRQAGWESYRGLGVEAVRPGLFLVGDSVFPGQSILASALGGARTASVVARGAA